MHHSILGLRPRRPSFRLGPDSATERNHEEGRHPHQKALEGLLPTPLRAGLPALNLFRPVVLLIHKLFRDRMR